MPQRPTKTPPAKPRPSPRTSRAPRTPGDATSGIRLLAGGNPQIAKADGDAPVQTYIAAIPGWKRDVAARLDALILRTVQTMQTDRDLPATPSLRKAIRWNSPFYGIDGRGWFVSFHVFTHYVKVTFFRGTSLTPAPTGGTRKDARWIDIHEHDFDEAQMTAWIRQAAALPGWLA